MNFHHLPEHEKEMKRAQIQEEEVSKWVLKSWPPTVWVPGAIEGIVAQFQYREELIMQKAFFFSQRETAFEKNTKIFLTC